MSDRPNILVILTDQHNPHVLGCYGNRIVRTPNLDRLAGEGMRFANTYCPAPWCVPSRMSFLTSRTPTHNRVWTNSHILNSGRVTWAHVLGAAGYETVLIGRMHFDGPDQRHGFERRIGGEHDNSHPGAPGLGGPMWTRYPPITCGQDRETVEIAGRGTTHYQWMDQQRTRAAVEFLRDRARHPSDRPFAAVLGYMLPHCPFISPKDLFNYYYDKVDIPPVEASQPATVTRFRRLRRILEPLSEERVRVARTAYFGLCEHIDSLVGRVLEGLDAMGPANNTLVVYTSDHGEAAGEHGCWWKSNYYQASASVPMIARLPGTVPAGRTCEAVCNLIDLGPTFAQIAGATFDPQPDGRSLWPTLQGSHPRDWVDETFCEFADSRDALTPSRMIRQGPWKLWHHAFDGEHTMAGSPPALFNLDDDPGELRDRSPDPACAAVRDRLMRRLYEDWDPQRIAAEAADGEASYRAIARWGRAVRPDDPDRLDVPPPGYEDDVELL